LHFNVFPFFSFRLTTVVPAFFPVIVTFFPFFAAFAIAELFAAFTVYDFFVPFKVIVVFDAAQWLSLAQTVTFVEDSFAAALALMLLPAAKDTPNASDVITIAIRLAPRRILS
jgi:hypothetical protein